MGSLADIIEAHIKKLISEAQRNMIEISRAEVASKFDCVPSQINYVLQTRFGPERGYVVESRRGGGGYIRIVKVSNIPKGRRLLDWIYRETGEAVSAEGCERVLGVLVREGIITEEQAYLAKAIIRTETETHELQNQNRVRASLLRACLLLVLDRR